MGEMMFVQSHEWLGVKLGKKRPQIMSAYDGQTWKKQKTSLNAATEDGVSSTVEMRRAMRAAMLKARFADTIFKARLLLEGGNKSDVSSLQQTKAASPRKEEQYGLKKRKPRSEAQMKAAEAASQRKDQFDLKKRREAQMKAAEAASQRKDQFDLKKRCEAQIKAAEAASQRKDQYDLKKRREAQIKAAEAASQRKDQYDLKKRREAARMALRKMEQSVDLDQNAASVLRELENLMGLPFGTGMGYPDTKQLERLGLYMKDNYLEEDEDIEEGEILS